MRAALERALTARWYGEPGLLKLLLPLSWLVRLVARLRRRLQTRLPSPVPLIVVGNISVGGTGKTPLVLALVAAARERRLRVGVIARGHGGEGPFPLRVERDTPPALCGDEPALLARVAGVPVVVDPRRLQALRVLCAQGVDLVISDDGLQHTALPRDIEIVVVDDRRRFGNGYCLPVGPLRESRSRLKRVDFIVGNGGDAGIGASVMQLQPGRLRELHGSQNLDVAAFQSRYGREVVAVAGIGDPGRFFATLRGLGFDVREHAFPDHHAFRVADFQELPPGLPVLMTAKDAVKCAALAGVSGWYLPVEARLPPGFFDAVFERLADRRQSLHESA